MIAICEECGKKYQVNLDHIQGRRASFSCKACEHIIIVRKPNAVPSPHFINEEGSDTVGLTEPQPVDDFYPERASILPASAMDSPIPTAIQPEQPEQKVGISLVTKFIGIMLVASLLPLILFWWITFSQNSQQVRTETENLADHVATSLAFQVDEWMDKNVRVLAALAKMVSITSMDPRLQEPLLKVVQEQYPWAYLVFTTDKKGMNISRNDGKPLVDYSDRQYYRDIITGKEVAWQVVIGKTSNKPTLVLAVSIKKGEEIIGVLASAMTIDDISRQIANWKRGQTGFAFLVDETGKVVAHQVEEFVTQQVNLIKHPLVDAFTKGKQGVIYFTDDKGIAYLGDIHGTKYGWALGIQQTEAEAFKTLHDQRYFAFLVLGLTVVGVLLLAWLSGKAMIAPIKKLTEAADRISIGELDVEIQMKSHDEIAALGDAISRMQDSIRLSMERLRRRR
jgi:methyl-accepting chemotaxis protein